MTADPKSCFEIWEQWPPAFLVHVRVGDISGSGIQVDAHHVVTCAHVLHPPGPEDFYAFPHGQRPDVTNGTATIRCGRFETTGLVIAQDRLLDLALIRHDKPRPGVAAPFAIDAKYKGAACVVGASHTGERLVALFHPITITSDPSKRGTTPIQGKHDRGATEGMSGGGVYAEKHGTPYFIGMATLGGERANMGAYIPAEAIVDFLEKELNLQRTPEPTSNRAKGLLSSGVASIWEFTSSNSQLALTFAPLLHRVSGVPTGASFISRRPITASQMRQQTRDSVLPGHYRLPAWAKSAEQAETVVRRLGETVGCRFRLPTPQELETAWLAPSGGGDQKAPEGRPLALYDFRSNEWGIEIPPLGAAEWARASNGTAYAIELSASHDHPHVTPIPAAQAAHREPSFRIAFDLEGT